MHVHPSADSRRCIVPGFLNLCLVEIVLSADPARAVHVQSPMHGVHTCKALVWTPETLRASQSARYTSVPCCLYLSEDSNALAYISEGALEGGTGVEGWGRVKGVERCRRLLNWLLMMYNDVFITEWQGRGEGGEGEEGGEGGKREGRKEYGHPLEAIIF